jgi:hypothetical protein
MANPWDRDWTKKQEEPQQPARRKALGNSFWDQEDPDMLEKGNIDLTTRPSVPLEDGRFASVRTTGFNFGGKEVNLPTVSDDGRLLSNEEAIEQYKRTGKHLGIYKTQEAAARAAEALHLDQEAMGYGAKAGQSEDQGYTKGATVPWERQWGANAPDVPEMTAGRAGGLAARMGLQAIPSAIAGVPALAMDAYDSLDNMGRMAMNTVLPEDKQFAQIPPFRHSGAVSDFGAGMADAAGATKPVGRLESGLVDIGTAALSAGGGAGVYYAAAKQFKNAGPTLSLIMEEFGRGPVTQTLGATGGAYATDLAQNADLPPAAVLGAGVLGGTLTGVGATGATRAAGAGRALYRPFTTAGRDVIAGKVINRFATNPALAAEYMENSVELVPGSKPTMAQVSRDPGLIAFEGGVRSTLDTGAAPGGGNRIGQRFSDQNTARQQYLNTVVQGPAELEAAQKLRARTFKEEGRPAFDGKSPVGVDPQPVFDRIASIRKSYDGKRTEVQGALKFAEERLSQQGVDYTDPEQLYAIRKDLANASRGKYQGKEDLKYARGQLDDVIRTLDRTIEVGAPGYARYMRIFEERARAVDQLKTMQKARTAGAAMASDPVTKMEELRLGPFQTAVQKALANGKGPKLTDEQIGVMQNVIDDLDRASAPSSNVVKVPGSDTMRNFSIGSVIGRIIGDNPGPAGQNAQAGLQRGAGKLLSWIYAMPDEQVGQLLVDAVLDPKLAARLSRQATTAEIESIARELAFRSRVGTTSSALYGR